jgi:hypothetical protein
MDNSYYIISSPCTEYYHVLYVTYCLFCKFWTNLYSLHKSKLLSSRPHASTRNNVLLFFSTQVFLSVLWTILRLLTLYYNDLYTCNYADGYPVYFPGLSLAATSGAWGVCMRILRYAAQCPIGCWLVIKDHPL